MLILPLYGICAIALTGIFFPWIKALQEPSVSLLYTASAISQSCFKDFSDWLQLSRDDAGRVGSRPVSSLPLIICLPTPSSSSSSIWDGTKDYIILPTDSSVATPSQSEHSLSLVAPFQVHPPQSFPTPSHQESGSVIGDGAGETFDSDVLTISSDGLSLFLGVVVSVLVAFHLVIYIAWKRDLARLDRQMEENKATASRMIEDLGNAHIVLDETEDSYLKGVSDGLETISKQTSSEAQIKVFEHLFVEGDSSRAPAPILFSTQRWTMSRLEFELTNGAAPRVPLPVEVEPSTAVPQLPVEESSKRKRSYSDLGSGNDDMGPASAAANDAQRAARRSDNRGRPTSIQSNDRISTVVSDIHVERPSVPKRPFLPVSARRPQRPPTRPSILDKIATPRIDIHAGSPSDTNTHLERRQQHISRPSTTVDIRVEGALDRNLVEQLEHPIRIESLPEAQIMSSVPVTEIVEPSALAMVDIHVEGATVAKVPAWRPGRTQKMVTRARHPSKPQSWLPVHRLQQQQQHQQGLRCYPPLRCRWSHRSRVVADGIGWVKDNDDDCVRCGTIVDRKLRHHHNKGMKKSRVLMIDKYMIYVSGIRGRYPRVFLP